jgi:peptide/nickel transport system permease protein
MVGLALLFLIGMATLLAPFIAPYNPDALDLDSIRQSPSWEHLMGTDSLGRDYFSRVLFGGRISLAVGIGVAMSAGIIGVTLGSLAGYRGGIIDNLVMRATDMFLALPFLAVAILLSTVLKGRAVDVVIILSVIFWMPVARIIRGLFLSIKEKEYIEAARAAGVKGFRIVWRHMLPNSLGPIIVNLTLGIAAAILAESALSFLGFGIQPPTATWGNMLADAEESMISEPWLVWFPGIMILITVLSVNFVGDGLRDALDPTTQRTRK